MLGELSPKINNNIFYDINYSPTLGDSTTNFSLNQINGTYSKVGNFVEFSVNCSWTAKNGASSTLILSLPPGLPIKNSVVNMAFEIGYSRGVFITSGYLQAVGLPGTNYITFESTTASGTPSFVLCNVCQTTGIVQVSGRYFI